ncbi:MAG: hypothetical protein WBB07_06740 [Mycobacterium sp.]
MQAGVGGQEFRQWRRDGGSGHLFVVDEQVREDRLIEPLSSIVAGASIERGRVFEQAEADVDEPLGARQIVNNVIELLGDVGSEHPRDVGAVVERLFHGAAQARDEVWVESEGLVLFLYCGLNQLVT